MRRTIENTEETIGNETFLRSSVSAGDEVDFGQWIITITQPGIDCDCGKAAFCPLNTWRRRS